jgi:predicted HTH domain antitoxin
MRKDNGPDTQPEFSASFPVIKDVEYPIFDRTEKPDLYLPNHNTIGHESEAINRPYTHIEAAVLRWFEESRISQGQASTLLGITRGEFFDVLAVRHVSPVQMTTADLEAEFQHG